MKGKSTMAKLAQYKSKLLQEFENRTDDWTFGDFEIRLAELRPKSNYQDAKVVILDGHKSGLYPKTIKKYLVTNYSAFGNVSSEFNSVWNDVYTLLSTTEKESLGLV